MGDLEFEKNALVKAVERGLVEQARELAEYRLSTPGGRFQVRRDEGGSATALGQLAFFAEFLDVTGVFERRVASCRWPTPVRMHRRWWMCGAPGCCRLWTGNGVMPM